MDYGKKKSNLGLILLAIIFIIAAFAGGYYISENNMFGKKEIKENEKTKEEVKTEEINEEDLTQISNRIDTINTNLAADFPIADVTAIDNQKFLQMTLGNIITINVIDEQIVEDQIAFYIGDNIKLKHEDYICNIDKQPFYKYNATNNWYEPNYENNLHGHGLDRNTYRVYNFFQSAKLEDDVLTINYKNLYYKVPEMGPPQMNLYDGPIGKGKEVLTNVTSEEVNSKYETIKDKLPITTYTFEKTKFNGYNLKSITIKE